MDGTDGMVKAAALGLMAAGALPFLAAAGLVVFTGGSFQGWIAEEIATLYGGIILSFLGGIRWGAALRGGRAGVLVMSVIPSLVGFAALLTDMRLALLLLIGGFGLQMVWDAMSAGPLPEWFIRLRLGITVVVIACLAVTLYGTY